MGFAVGFSARFLDAGPTLAAGVCALAVGLLHASLANEWLGPFQDYPGTIGGGRTAQGMVMRTILVAFASSGVLRRRGRTLSE